MSWKMLVRSHHLGFVPDAMGVDDIQYAQEERWGLPLIGIPGDNETGIIVYKLPGQTVAGIHRKGVAYLQELPANKRSNQRGWRGSYGHWRATPFDQEARSRMTRAYTDIPRDCGFCIRVDPDVWAEVERIVGTPGSYYAFGRTGVIVISPGEAKAIYMYKG
ncbi:MAG TPA: hypothetical protein VN017_01945 [Pseudoxanthomonas sp.]|nr:hypothetical protein [Pseudoxanthomonas sp.]